VLEGWRIPQHASLLCQKGAVDGVCSCIVDLLSDSARPDLRRMAPQVAAWHKLVYLTKFIACEACKCWCRSVIATLADAAEANVEQWQVPWSSCGTEVMQGHAKRRRVDHHLKQHVLQTASHSAPTVTTAAREVEGVDSAQALRWVSKEMSAYRANCMLDMAASQVVGFTADAARVGKPAREFLAGYFTDPVRSRHGALPCQVVSISFSHPTL
jgi:hypothetical protein